MIDRLRAVALILTSHPLYVELMRLKQQIGFLLQFLVLTATPLISWWQLQFGYKLIWMPGLLTLAAFVFWIGTMLREGGK